MNTKYSWKDDGDGGASAKAAPVHPSATWNVLEEWIDRRVATKGLSVSGLDGKERMFSVTTFLAMVNSYLRGNVVVVFSDSKKTGDYGTGVVVCAIDKDCLINSDTGKVRGLPHFPKEEDRGDFSV